jgi:beta-glucosidase-like glycosyl hydrolase/CubicO group peptidase (beta-lactamase class C family)
MLNKKIKILVLTISFILFGSFTEIESIKIPIPSKIDPPFSKYLYNHWVDSTLKSMTIDEKIGQLFMVAAYSNKDQKHIDKISNLINKYHIGGLIFFQGGPVRQANQTNLYQKISITPLLIASDWEWGLAMRLDSTVRYPRQMMLGAIQDNNLIYEMGTEIAKQCNRIGTHVNFAPVIDINNNPKNPVIGSRSFGENRENVAEKGYNYMLGLQDNNIIATGKHFPGHGDTDTDSHKALPIINHSKDRLDSIELYPFKELINSGLGGIMVAHIHIPALDSTPNIATTLSKKVSTDLLKNELMFKGIAFTDALNMKGVSSYFEPGEVDLMALKAGNDILLFPKSVETGVAKIKEALEKGEITEGYINEKVRKILAVKYWVGLSNKQKIQTKNLYEDLNNKNATEIKRKLIENAITLVKNDKGYLPFTGLDTLKIASLSVGNIKENEFQKTLKLYANVKSFNVKKFASEEEWQILKNKLKEYNLVIVSFNKTNRILNKNYGISLASMKKVENLAKSQNVIIDLFANPYSLKHFENIDNFKAVLVSYNDWDITQNISAQVIFGAIPAKGKLPISINNKFNEGTGVVFNKSIRLKYTSTKDAGMRNDLLYKIDSIALNGIKEQAYPGCQIIAAKNGKIFYNKCFGAEKYDKVDKITSENIYDLASITKIVASTVSLMKLYDDKQFDFNKTLSYYLPYLDSTNKSDLLIKDVITHQAMLNPWIPFYLKTIKTDEIRDSLYSKFPINNRNTIVADNMYILDSYKDTMYKRIAKSKLLKKKEYRYSDLGFYYMQQIIETQTNKSIAKYVKEIFYSKLGAYTLGYNPLIRFRKSQIVPTENDLTYRKQLIQGYVHDMGSAMMGGVGGHAGVFSNANDLAKIMQMFLNFGEYGGTRYINTETVKLFSTCQFCPENRRALGFDKPEMRENRIGPTCNLVSPQSFGHTGFTGTYAWVDPKNGILYIFLSNRIYPNMSNKKLIRMGVRTKIQKIIYQSIDTVNYGEVSLN